MKNLLQNKSRCRRLQYEWLAAHSGRIPAGKTLDLGGVKGAEYHGLLKLEPGNVLIWNMDPAAAPDAFVDLDEPDRFPALPAGVSTILAMNLLEHLYRPFELLTWACRSLPSGGQLVVAVPFAYPIHPSPNDYWRITPQAFERFFGDLERQKRISGDLTVSPLGSDFREGTSLFTSELFKSTRTHRALGALIENSALVASAVGRLVAGPESVRNWAGRNPTTIGLLWVKH